MAAVTGHSTERTRELLLKAAKILFAGKGFDGTSVKELADHAGVNISLVSYHFGGKEGLYRACVEQFGHSRLEFAKRVLVQPKTFEEFELRFRMFVSEMLECFAEEPEFTKIVQRDCELDEPLIQDIFAKTLFKVYTMLIEFVESAQKSGHLYKKMDAQIVASSLFGALTSFSRTDQLNKKYFGKTILDPGYRKKVTEELCQLFTQGIRHGGE